MWDPPRAGKEPVSPALAAVFCTTEPPGKPSSFLPSFPPPPSSLPPFLPSLLSSDKAKLTGNSTQCSELERRWWMRLLLLGNCHADLYLVFTEKSGPEGSQWKPLWHGASPRDTELEAWSSVCWVSTGLSSFCNCLSVPLTIQGLPCLGDSGTLCTFLQICKAPHAPQLNTMYPDVQFSSVQSLSAVRLFATPWIAALQASLSITSSRSLLKLMSIQSVMPSSHLILCRPLLLLPPIPPSIRVFSNESTLRMRWPKYWSFQMVREEILQKIDQFSPYTFFSLSSASCPKIIPLILSIFQYH